MIPSLNRGLLIVPKPGSVKPWAKNSAGFIPNPANLEPKGENRCAGGVMEISRSVQATGRQPDKGCAPAGA